MSKKKPDIKEIEVNLKKVLEHIKNVKLERDREVSGQVRKERS